MDFGKCFNASLFPGIAATVFAIAASLLQFVIEIIPCIGCVSGPILTIINGIILIWAGYRAIKDEKLELADGAVSGLLAGLGSSAIAGILKFALAALGVGAVTVPAGMDAITLAIGGASIFAHAVILVIGVATWSVIGLLAGLIGAFAAQNMK